MPEPRPDLADVIGFVVWDAKYGLTYRGHVYETHDKAEQGRAGIVWHSRARYKVRAIALAALAAAQEEATHE